MIYNEKINPVIDKMIVGRTMKEALGHCRVIHCISETLVELKRICENLT